MKKLLSLFVVVLFVFALSSAVLAESTVMDPWSVTFTADEKMVQDFGSGNSNRTINGLNNAVDDELRGMQPGDDITFSIVLQNSNASATNWYMTNSVLDSLEDSVSIANGGAYTYQLIYSGPGGTETLFDSDTVGGDETAGGREGLNEATSSLEDFFYLDNLATGQSGTVSLRVALDGETQGNDYQSTLADLQMNFAVELTAEATPVPEVTPTGNPSVTPTPATVVVMTGDEYQLVPYYIAMAVSGVLFLLLAVDGIRRRKKGAKAR